jgi:hypothetical protein
MIFLVPSAPIAARSQSVKQTVNFFREITSNKLHWEMRVNILMGSGTATGAFFLKAVFCYFTKRSPAFLQQT